MSGKWDLYYMICIAWVVKDELKIPSFKNIFEDSVRHICTVLKIEDPQLSLSLFFFRVEKFDLGEERECSSVHNSELPHKFEVGEGGSNSLSFFCLFLQSWLWGETREVRTLAQLLFFPRRHCLPAKREREEGKSHFCLS